VDGQTLEAQDLIKFVGTRIAGFKKPRYVEFVSEIPLVEDGSPDRVRVKELYGGPQE
jgi:long-chain acyl-CoA synthetase